MRRSIPVLTATAGALALLAGFHTTPASTGGTVGGRGSPSAAGPPPQPAPAGGDGPASIPTTSAPTPTVPPRGSAATTSATRVVDGPVVSNRYGDVQVRVTLRGRQIVDIQALRLPSDRSRSAEISRFAGPVLRSEALQAQSAQIDAVSGASYTSESYAQSLQGALDHA